jgi:hypothetical protein
MKSLYPLPNTTDDQRQIIQDHLGKDNLKITDTEVLWMAAVKVHRDTLSAKELKACEEVIGWRWEHTEAERRTLWAFIEVNGKVPDYFPAVGCDPAWHLGCTADELLVFLDHVLSLSHSL